MPAVSDILPAFPAIWSWRMVQDTDVTRSLSGKLYARERAILRFEVTLRARPMTPQAFAPVVAFLAAHTGPANVFFVAVQQRVAGALVQPGNYVNWSTSPDGKLYLVTAKNPLTVIPAKPPGGSARNATAYLRCVMKGNSQQYQDDKTGLVSFTLTLEESLL